MKLTGIIEEVFGTCTIFRGYATLKTLVELSSRPGYQRQEDSKRTPQIIDYLRNTSFRFFPELIFGWQIDNPSIITDLKNDPDKSSIAVSDGIKIKKAKFRFQKNVEPSTKMMTIEIKNREAFVLSRIDGNHRLCAVSKIIEENPDIVSEIGNLIVPFSILIQTKNDEADKREAAYFYLINSKAEKLTDEQNLNAIFAGGKFDELEKKNLAIVDDVIRFEEITKKIIDGDYSFVNDIFQNEPYTFALKICKNIEGNIEVKKIKDALVQIESLYNTDTLPSKNKSIIISLLVAYAKHGIDFFNGFKAWLQDNQLGEIEKVKPSELLSAFEKLREEIKIFVAMPFFDNDPNVVESYNKAYESVLNQLKEIDKTLNISNFPIMTNVGETRDINNQIFDQIDKCNILIADITGNCLGVYLEYGYAKGKDKYRILLKSDKKEDEKDKPHFDLEHDSRVSYKSNDNLLDFKKKVAKHLMGILNDHYGYKFTID